MSGNNLGIGSISNYSGRIPDVAANVKNYVVAREQNSLVTIQNINGVPTITFTADLPVYINNDITFGHGSTMTSDERLKTDITKVTKETADLIMNLEVKEFSYKDETNKNRHYGFIAQNVEKVLPNLVEEKQIKSNKEVFEPAYKTVNYLEIIPLLVQKIQDLQQQIDELKSNK